MMKSLVSIFKLKQIIYFNKFIDSFKRIFVLKDIFNSELYRLNKAKYIVAFVMRAVLNLGISSVIAMILLSSFAFEDKSMLGIAFTLYFLLLKPVFSSNMLHPDVNGYYMIRQIKMKAKDYIISEYIYDELFDYIVNIPILVIAASHFSSPLSFISLSLIFVFGGLFGQMINMILYKRIGKYRHWLKIVPVIAMVLAVIYNSRFYNFVDSNMLVFVLIYAVLFVISFVYFKNFDYLVIKREIHIYERVKGVKKDATAAIKASVKVREKDIKVKSSVYKYKGYEFLNRLFIQRHKRVIFIAMWIITGIIAVVCIGWLGFILFAPTVVQFQLERGVYTVLNNNMGIFLLITYISSIGATYTKALFINCDSSLLSFSFYKTRDSIIKNFNIRLIQSIRLSLLPNTIIAVTMILSVLFLQVEINPIIVISAVVIAIAYSVLFCFHYLFVYYFFQPYNQDLQSKSKIYTIINIVVYIVSINIWDKEIPTLLHLLFVVSVLVVYYLVGTNLIKKYGRKRFKVYN